MVNIRTDDRPSISNFCVHSKKPIGLTPLVKKSATVGSGFGQGADTVAMETGITMDVVGVDEDIAYINLCYNIYLTYTSRIKQGKNKLN